jgi:hypothetical protein
VAVKENFESLPEKISSYDLKTACVTENIDGKVKIAYRGSDYTRDMSYEELPTDTVLFEIELNDLYGDEIYDFDKNDMKRIGRAEVEAGELLYYYVRETKQGDKQDGEQENSGDETDGTNNVENTVLKTRAIIIVSQSDKNINEKTDIQKYMNENLELELDDKLIEITNLDDNWQFFDSEKGLMDVIDENGNSDGIQADGLEKEAKNNSNHKIRTNDFLENYGENIRYIPTPWSNKYVNMVFYPKAKGNYMGTVHLVDAEYDSVEKQNDSYRISYKDSYGNLHESYLSQLADDCTVLNVESKNYKEGEKIRVYVNEMNCIESIKKAKQQSNSEFFKAFAEDADMNPIDDSIFEVKVLTEDKSKKTVFLDFDTISKSPYGLSDLMKLKVDESNYVEFAENVSDEYKYNVYRLLNIGDGKVELGFNNLSGNKMEKFSINERAWVELDEDYTWFSEANMSYYLNKDVAVDMNESGKIQSITPYNIFAIAYPYNGNSPTVKNVPLEMSFEVAAAVKGQENGISFKSCNRFCLDEKVIDIDSKTNFYEYDYDSDYLKSNMNEWEALWNRNFENVKGLKDLSIESINTEDNSVYLVSRNKDYIAKNIVRINPIKKEISKIIFRSTLIKKDYSGKRESNTICRCVDLDDAYDRLYGSSEKEASGWFLMNEENSKEYFVLRSSETRDLSYEEKKILEDSEEKTSAQVSWDDYLDAESEDEVDIKNSFYSVGIIREFDGYSQDFDVETGKADCRIDLFEDKSFEEWFPNWSAEDIPTVYRFKTSSSMDHYSLEPNILQEATAIARLDEPITYKFLGTLDGEYVFGYGGKLESEYFDVNHSFKLSEEDMTACSYLEKFGITWNNKMMNEPYYYQGKVDDGGTIEFMQRFYRISAPHEEYIIDSKKGTTPDEIDGENEEKKCYLHMAEKSLTGKTLSGEYIDENIEIVEVMKLQDEKDEIILKIKRENGKIAEIVSESDSWLGYEIGQKLFVRMRLKDENPVAICWVMGND